MLAQNFMTAEALGITEDQQIALTRVLGALERGEIPSEEFSMTFVDCGTTACLLGWAVRFDRGSFKFPQWNSEAPDNLKRLFVPDTFAHEYGEVMKRARCCKDTNRAAHALRNYLTTGEPCWDEVMTAP